MTTNKKKAEASDAKQRPVRRLRFRKHDEYLTLKNGNLAIVYYPCETFRQALLRRIPFLSRLVPSGQPMCEFPLFHPDVQGKELTDG